MRRNVHLCLTDTLNGQHTHRSPLGTARSFLTDWYAIWWANDGRRRTEGEARLRYEAWRADARYGAVAPLRRVQTQATDERFGRLSPFLRNPRWEATNNGAERAGRAFRHRQDPHFNLRSRASIDQALAVTTQRRKIATTGATCTSRNRSPPADAGVPCMSRRWRRRIVWQLRTALSRATLWRRGGDGAMQRAPDEVTRFYRIWFALLRYVNDRRHVIASFPARPDEGTPDEGTLQPADAVALRDALWADDALRAGFIADNPAALPPTDLALVGSWRHRVAGRFFIERYLTKHTIFLSEATPVRAYGVLGLVSPIAEIVGPPCPFTSKRCYCRSRGGSSTIACWPRTPSRSAAASSGAYATPIAMPRSVMVSSLTSWSLRRAGMGRGSRSAHATLGC